MKKALQAAAAVAAIATGTVVVASHDSGKVVVVETVVRGKKAVETWRVYKDGRAAKEPKP